MSRFVYSSLFMASVVREEEVGLVCALDREGEDVTTIGPIKRMKSEFDGAVVEMQYDEKPLLD